MGVSESEIFFRKAGGHRHDGSTSSLIDYTKYSIFDFDTSSSTNGQDRARDTIRQNNRSRFDQYIAAFIATQILEPAGIVLLENSVRGIHIGADEITANNIAAETITANEIAANTITGAQIAANTITADKLQVGAISAGSVTIANNGVPNGDFWSSNGSFRLGGANGINYTGSTINLGSNTVITGSVDIGGPDNDSLQIDTNGALWIGHRTFGSAPFRVYSNGRVIAGGSNGVDIGTNGSMTVSGSTTVGGTMTVNSTTFLNGSTSVSGGLTVSGNGTISGNLAVNGTTQINGPITFGSGIGTVQIQSNVSITGGISIGSGSVTISSVGDITRPGVWSLTNTGFYAGPGNIVSVTASGLSFPAGGIFDSGTGGVGLRVGSNFKFIINNSDTITVVTATGSGNALHYDNTFGFLLKTSSMRKLKDNIDYNISGLEMIKKLKPASFTWKPQKNDSPEVAALRPLKKNYGFIAEDIAEANKSLAVWEAGVDWDMPDEEKIKKIKDLENWIPSYYDHAGLLCFLVAAVKELSDKLDALEAKI